MMTRKRVGRSRRGLAEDRKPLSANHAGRQVIQMKSTDPHIRTELVDGEEVIIPDECAWKLLREDFTLGEWSARSSSLLGAIWADFHFARHHTRFVLGLRRLVIGKSKDLLPLLLFRMGERWQRVSTEGPACTVCGWMGFAATPLSSDLYLGLPNRSELLKATAELPEVPCPRCGSQFPGYRHYIWTEPYPLPTID